MFPSCAFFVGNALSVGDDALLWGMMSPSQSDGKDDDIMTDRPHFSLTWLKTLKFKTLNP
jgi:hypothetical protein